MEKVLTPYEDYRDPELRWLDAVPSHWEVQRAKTVFSEIDKRSQTGEERLLTVSSSDGVRPREEQTVTMFQAESYVGHKLCWPGDLVVNSLWAWAKGLGVSDHHGIVSTAYGVYRPREPYKRFTSYFHSLLRSEAYDWEFTVRSQGIWTSRLQLSDTSFFDMPILLPPEEEARQIGAFVETLDRKVDRLIDAKERLIALLEEQKQGVIQRAVTRGLDPDAAMKPSGVDWLGEVPAHWEVRRLKSATPNRVNGLWGSDATGSDDVPCVRVADFDRSALRARLGNPTMRSIPKSKREGRILEKGDLLLEKSGGGDNQPVGVVVIYDHEEPAVCSNFIARMEVADGYDPSYLVYLHAALYASRVNVKSVKQTTGIQNLDATAYLDEKASFPPLPEQQRIVAHIQQRTRRIDTAIEKAESQIELIREYRTRLVSDVVTGRLDVTSPPKPQPRRQKPTKTHAEDRAPAPFRRSTVAAGITERLRGTKGFGRVQLQKALVVSERHLKLDLDIKAKRDELGPFDNNAMRSVHAQFVNSGWFKPIKQHGTWRYDVLPKLDGYKKYFDGFIHGQMDEFERLMRLFEKMDSTQSEIVATLYVAWNDELIEGHTPSDEKLLDEVLNNWHPRKRRFPPAQWQRALDWMRDPERGNLIPKGFGPSSKED